LKKKFIDYCISNKFEQNSKQIETLELLIDFYSNNLLSKSIFSKFLNKKSEKLGFYLFGDVGVGKTMILDFYYNHLSIKKNRMHFNEFMINFHDYRHQERTEGKNGNIDRFVNKLKDQFDLIYLDEFQVTNIVDAMILGKLFETIFEKRIKVILSSNIKIDDLYKDGLQRDQFLPFLEIIKKNCIQHELIIDQDYRRSALAKLERYFYPVNEQSFHFNELCSVNIGAEDYIAIANNTKFIVIDELPIFNDDNSDKQSRFITLIDILYEKQIPLMVSSDFNLDNFESSKKLDSIFKRTVSRLFELTSPKFSIN
jgi:cell division protein ZapE